MITGSPNVSDPSSSLDVTDYILPVDYTQTSVVTLCNTIPTSLPYCSVSLLFMIKKKVTVI